MVKESHRPMKVAIIAYGVEGKSAYNYWQANGADITICDAQTDIQIPAGALAQLGPDYLKHLDRFDLIVRTASVHPNAILKQNPGVEAKITTVINEFMTASPTHNIVGVTGTKGKGTTTSLIAKMLEAGGKTVYVGGNIGVSPLDFLDQLTEDSWVVLELSSFQLYDLRRSPHIGVCLMIAPEHLNWHSDMNDYVQAKSQLFRHQAADDVAIYFAANEYSSRIAAFSSGTKIPYFEEPGAYVQDDDIVISGQRICSVQDVCLPGKHNLQNVCAAITAVWQAVPDAATIRAAITQFSGLEHRLEFVREVDDIQYYDDSFGTTPETAIVALEAFEAPKVIILGGSDKGSDYAELAATVANTNVRHAILIGQMGPKIGQALKEAGFTNATAVDGGMAEIVATASACAHPGDVVLLSTACASFGMFKNYKDRGQQFKAAVEALEPHQARA